MAKFVLIYQSEDLNLCYGVYGTMEEAKAVARKTVLKEMQEWCQNGYTISNVKIEEDLEADAGYRYFFHIKTYNQEHDEKYFILVNEENQKS